MVDVLNRCCRVAVECIDDNDSPHGFREGLLYNVKTTDEQIMSDVALEREHRREGRGYVTPSQAVAFLEPSRHLTLTGSDVPSWDLATIAYFREVAGPEPAGDSADDPPAATAAPPPADVQHGVAEVLTLLREAGVVHTTRRRGLPEGRPAERRRLSRIDAHLVAVRDHDEAAHAERTQEMGYLANVLVAGCSYNSKRFDVARAADAALAVCNLGLENWPPAWRASMKGPFLSQDLVTVFRVGWTVLHERVSMYVARSFVDLLEELTIDDKEVDAFLGDLAFRLRREVKAGAPWRATKALDVVAILDLPSWSILLGLLDECPVVPKSADQIAPGQRRLRETSEVEFISENSQIAWVRDFVASLPTRLSS